MMEWPSFSSSCLLGAVENRALWRWWSEAPPPPPSIRIPAWGCFPPTPTRFPIWHRKGGGRKKRASCIHCYTLPSTYRTQTHTRLLRTRKKKHSFSMCVCVFACRFQRTCFIHATMVHVFPKVGQGTPFLSPQFIFASFRRRCTAAQPPPPIIQSAGCASSSSLAEEEEGNKCLNHRSSLRRRRVVVVCGSSSSSSSSSSSFHHHHSSPSPTTMRFFSSSRPTRPFVERGRESDDSPVSMG